MRTILILLVLFLLLWDPLWRLYGVHQTFPWELQSMLEADPKSVELIDVRTEFEYNLFHIPGAISSPAPGLPPGHFTGKDVVIICMTGHRSPFMANALQNLGVPNVSNLTWGMAGWLATGGRVISGKERGEFASVE